jgi:hypothetical protein
MPRNSSHVVIALNNVSSMREQTTYMSDTAGMMLHHQTTARNCTFAPKQPKSSARALPGLRVTARCLPFPHQPRVPLLASTHVSGTMVSKSVCASTAADHASAAFRDMLIRAHE